MKRFAIWTGSIIAILILTLLIVPVLMKDKIIGIVKSEANKMLTAQLDFQELDISLIRNFPNASVSLDGLSLVGGVEPFVGDTIVAAEHIAATVDIMSIFGDEGFDIHKVLLRKPTIHARIDTLGRVNWDVMKSDSTQVEEVVDSTQTEEPSTFRLALRELSIEDAELRYDDDSSRMYASIAPLSLKLKGDFSAQKSNLELSTLLKDINFTMDGVKFANSIEAELNANIDADLDEQLFTLKDNSFRLNAIEMTIDGMVDLQEEGIDMDLKLNTNKVAFREILSLIPAFYTKDFKDLTASGDLVLGAWAKGRLTDELLPAFALELGVKGGSFKYAALPQSVTGIRIDAKVENPGGVLDATRIHIPTFGLTMAGNSLTAALTAATPISDLSFNASAAGKVDLGAIKQVYPLPDTIKLAGVVTLDAKVAGRMSDIERERYEQMQASGTITLEQMKAEIQGIPTVDIERMSATLSPKAVTLSECKVKVGKSDLNATGSLTNFLGWYLRDDTLNGSLNLSSSLLDLNELMGYVPESEPSAAEATPESEEQTAQSVAPEIPKNLNLALNTKLSQIKFMKMNISDFTGNIALKGGAAELSRLSMKALGGSLTALGSYSTAQSAKSPKLILTANINNASFSQTFKELDMIQKIVPLFEKAGGTYSMKLSISSRMTEDMGIDYPTLNATGKLSTSNIELGNVPIFKALTSAIKAGSAIESSLAGRLIIIDFSIKNGRLTTNPFDIKLGKTTMNISGSTGLDQTIDYTATVSMPGKASNVLEKLDVKILGTFSKPKISVDVKAAAKEAVTNIVNEQIQKLTGSESLSEEISKQAEKLREEARKAGDALVAEAKKQKDALVAKSNNALAKVAAEAAGNALVKEAEKQAAKLVSEAEKRITQLEQEAKNKTN